MAVTKRGVIVVHTLLSTVETYIKVKVMVPVTNQRAIELEKKYRTRRQRNVFREETTLFRSGSRVQAPES
ncbi:hypothetical protein BRY73_17450 [Ochrobactrum sp. P6BS-III]|nr:hypothetical protein [Ochrobactrum sp. P6BSIII]OOL15756.1 hypothetical protein BRY73_17450 [Ochrobactrum sp. P6BS-III]